MTAADDSEERQDRDERATAFKVGKSVLDNKQHLQTPTSTFSAATLLEVVEPLQASPSCVPATHRTRALT
jgi:hypothetical protein